MPIETVTISVCDRCGSKHERSGSESTTPPIDWAEVQLTYREEGSGWANRRTIRAVLCPSCAGGVEAAIEGK